MVLKLGVSLKVEALVEVGRKAKDTYNKYNRKSGDNIRM